MQTSTNQVNTAWFKGKLADRQLSGRQLAKQIGMDAAALSLMIRGKRGMKAGEAAAVAEALREPVEDVLKAAGIYTSASTRQAPAVVSSQSTQHPVVNRPTPSTYPDDTAHATVASGFGASENAIMGRSAQNSVAVAGWVDSRGFAHFERAHGPGFVPAPPGLDGQCTALRWHTEGLWDGWVAYYCETAEVCADAVGRLCVVSMDGRVMVRQVTRGYEPGTCTLRGMDGAMETGKPEWAAPILWLKQ